jgi:hypothetical protein
MNRKFFVSGLTVAAASSLVACGGAMVASTPGGRHTRAFQPAIDDNPPPAGTTPNPSVPGTDLKQIGSVTAHRAAADPAAPDDTQWFDWDPANGGVVGATKKYFGQVMRLDKALLSCVISDGTNALSIAGALAAYLQTPQGKALPSVTADIILYAGLWSAGAIASPLEFLGAVAAVLTVGDWVIAIGAIGAATWEVYNIMKCGIDRVPSTS